MSNKIILSLLLVCALAIPVFAKAVSVDDLRALIAQLQAQIQALQVQLQQTQGQQPVQWCHTFNTNLGIGSSGAEFDALQTALMKDGASGADLSYDSAAGMGQSSKFGEYTASAVVGFQQKYASEILTPLGLKHGTGYLGKSTRAKLNKLYGCGNLNVCTMDVKQCPDGSYVSRKGPNCEFAQCPTINKSITVLSPNGGEVLTENSKVVDSLSSVDSQKQIFEIKWTGAPDSFQDVYGSVSPARVAAYLEQNVSGQYNTIGRIIPQAYGSIMWIVGIVSDTNCLWNNDNASKYPNHCFYSQRLVSPGTYNIKIVDTQTNAFGRSNSFSIVSQTQNTCTDTDGGKSYYTKGTTNDGITIGDDVCDFTILKERYCDAQSKFATESYICPNGCIDGACKPIATTPVISCEALKISGAEYFNVCRKNNYAQVCFNKNTGVYQGCTTGGGVGCTSSNSNANSNIACDVAESTQKSISITSPTGGETLKQGDTFTIRWKSSGLPSDAKVYLALTRSDGANSGSNIATNIPASQGFYSWKIPVISSQNWAMGYGKTNNVFTRILMAGPYQYRIFIGTDWLGKDVSKNQLDDVWSNSNYFSIVEQLSTSCTDSDSGSNIYEKGNTYGNLAYFGDGYQGKFGEMHDFCVQKGSNGSYPWQNEVNSTNIYNRHEVGSCTSNCAVYELYCTSNGYITSQVANCPNGCSNGACVAQPVQNSIDLYPGAIKIDQNGFTVEVWNVGTKTPSSVSVQAEMAGVKTSNYGYMSSDQMPKPGGYGIVRYEYSTFNNPTPGATYSLVFRVDPTNEISEINENDNVKTYNVVVPVQKSISVVSPNGGETFKEGDSLIIKWSSANIANVQAFIRNVSDNSSQWILLNTISDISASSKTFSWLIPVGYGTNAGSHYKIKVSESGGSVYDESDSYFSIVAPTTPVACSDTDGGYNLYEAGTVKGNTDTSIYYRGSFLGSGYREVIDYCYQGDPGNAVTEGDHLKEYSCLNGKLTFGDRYCACSSGKCVQPQSVNACVDTDGDNAYLKGKTTGIYQGDSSSFISEGIDYCSNNQVLENYCVSGTIYSAKWVSCPNGCLDGACKK
ncbi:MAG: Ser-Thr-rich GPI-anchored membrane family protein [bacterium]|nr:Ser-Thr-rich GPI-anchored membrane family protein [bacterium]